MSRPSTRGTVRRFFVTCKISGGRIGSATFVIMESPSKIKLYDDELQVNSLIKYLNGRFNHPDSPYRFQYERAETTYQRPEAGKKV